jgi:indole-3-glycerol phosphate synthase
MDARVDHLDRLARDALRRIDAGAYATRVTFKGEICPRASFVEAIRKARTQGLNAVIAELKPASPSAGNLLKGRDPRALVAAFARAGTCGLSVLTDPQHFGGSLAHLRWTSELGLPTLMKDFLLDPVQIEACAAYGGSAVLLILTLFRRGYARLSLEAMIEEAHARGLEVLLEVNSLDEYNQALDLQADMIGINARDLATLQVDLGVVEKILRRAPKPEGRPVWALSGIESPQDLERLKAAGADAFLVGTSLMRANAPEALLRRLVHARGP